MLFNSYSFLVFLPIVFISYWYVFSKSKVTQNIFLLFTSYIFYSFWDWRFSFLLAFSTILDYTSGRIIFNTNDALKKKFWMRLSIFINLGLLCYFKYLNFFIDSFDKLLNSLNLQIDTTTLEIILPIGISFYTFHGVSYVMDIYYGRITADKNIIDYSLFVSFFPLLVAGPIERATHLLPQLKQKKYFNHNQAIRGCQLILWGMFKKIVVADSLAPIVDDVFLNYHNYSGITLLVTMFAFAFQVYGDFSGYSDIARGVSKLLGIELILNFNLPFFSKSISEFWSRWHISLSSWLNDYVFTPFALRFRDLGKYGIFIAVFLTFLISGLWHGASWNFVIWGGLHGLFYFPVVFSNKGFRSITGKSKNLDLKISDVPNIFLTFLMFSFTLIFFRSSTMSDSIGFIQHVFNSNSSVFLNTTGTMGYQLLITFLSLCFLMFSEFRMKQKKHLGGIYYLIAIFMLLYFGQFKSTASFIYFQF
jgi:alginate O-acetyltransferase complex protein AlgI